LEEAAARGERPERFFGEGNLNAGKVNPPKFPRPALGEVPQGVAATASQLEGTKVGCQFEQAQRVFRRRQRPILRKCGASVEARRHPVPARAIRSEGTLWFEHNLPRCLRGVSVGAREISPAGSWYRGRLVRGARKGGAVPWSKGRGLFGRTGGFGDPRRSC